MENIIEFIANNTMLSLAVLTAGLAAIFNELRIKAQSLGSLSPAQAVQLINGGAQIVDVRPAEEYATAHMIGAQNMTPSELANSKKLKAKKGVLLVCANGSKSTKALVELRKAGFENSFSLKGGIAAWQQENLPVEAA